MPDGSSQETSGTGGRSSTGEAASARPAGRSPGETDIFMVRKLWSPAGAGRRGAARSPAAARRCGRGGTPSVDAARVMRRDGQRVSANHAPDRRRNEWSGRRESNPHDQLGRSVWVHLARRANTYALVTRVRRSVVNHDCPPVTMASGPYMARAGLMVLRPEAKSPRGS